LVVERRRVVGGVLRGAGALLLAGAALAAAAGIALAHAQYVSSTPANGSIVAAAPTRISAKFSEGVRPAGSSMTVFAPDGSRADNGDSAVDTTDASRTTMTVSLKSGLPNGTYAIRWTTVSADDGDTATGFFSFSVGAPSLNLALPRTGGGPMALPLGMLGVFFAAAGMVVRRSAR
jgi:methionine-rich copper-binding protein CopC